MANALVGIIGGSGLGDALVEQFSDATTQTVDTPFGPPSGPITLGRFGDRDVAFLNRHGQGHYINPSSVPYAANIFALKNLGVRTILASGAVGSLREEIAPGHLVVVDQFIDKTCKRQSSFFDELGAVHCEMAEPVCTRVHQAVCETAKPLKMTTHPSGTYVCMEGPQFSTRAESLMHRGWGGDLIGMTAMPEAKLAREAQICYGLIGLASDYDCWREHDSSLEKQALLAEIIGNLQAATQNCLELMRSVLASDQDLLSEDCHCRKSLELAVWTDPKAIDADLKESLQPLFE
jgi:5'-methylthioadenosine phosphorylase